MPYSSYDPAGEILEAYIDSGVSLIVLLADDNECLRKTGRNLRELYISNALEVVYLPVEDFGVPDGAELEVAIVGAAAHAAKGGSFAIHCHAGIGRTGVFAACLAKRAIGLTGEESIRWVRQYIPGAVELPEQEQFVKAF
jgi:protein-tyrosine phosphatase